jgi:hypothetical protein
MLEKYRNKYANKFEVKNKKELLQIMRKINEDIDYTQQRIR